VSENSGTEKPGRNAPCPCGSGDKYKVCCGKEEAPPVAEPSQPLKTETVELAIEKEVTYICHGTQAVRVDDGLKLAFIVTEGGQPVQMVFQVGPEGKKHIAQQATGGIVVP